MDVSKLPYHEQQQIKELQALLHDWRSGKFTPTKPEANILRLVETITLACLISPDEGSGDT